MTPPTEPKSTPIPTKASHIPPTPKPPKYLIDSSAHSIHELRKAPYRHIYIYSPRYCYFFCFVLLIKTVYKCSVHILTTSAYVTASLLVTGVVSRFILAIVICKNNMYVLDREGREKTGLLERLTLNLSNLTKIAHKR